MLQDNLSETRQDNRAETRQEKGLLRGQAPAWLNASFLFLFIASISVFIIVMPKQSDDYWYMLPLSDWYAEQEVYNPDFGGDIINHGLPWESIKDIWESHYNYDNARLSNIIVPFFLLLPKWFGSSIMAILAAWTIFLFFKLVHIDWRRSWFVVPVLACVAIFVPWIDSMGSMVYQFNYILPGWLCMLFTLFLFRRVEGETPTRRVDVLLALLLGVIIGMIHEGFAIPLIVSVAVMIAARKKWRGKLAAAGLTGLCIGMVWILVSPSLWTRIDMQVGGKAFDLGALTSLIFKSCELLMLAVAMILYIWLKKDCDAQRESVRKSDLLLYALTGAFTTCMICVVTQPGMRLSYWIIYMSVAADVVLLRLLKQRIVHGLLWLARTLYCLMLLFLTGVIFFWAYYGVQFHRAWYKCVEEYRKDSKAYVFAENPLPDWMRGVADVTFRLYGPFLINYFHGFQHQNAFSTAFIPKELEYVDSSTGELISDTYNIRTYKGYYFVQVPEDSELYKGTIDEPAVWEVPKKSPGIRMYVEYPGGKNFRYVMLSRFRSAADGKLYLWIYPQLPWNFYNARKVTRMEPEYDNLFSVE